MQAQMRQESLAAARTLRACKLCRELRGAAKEFEAVEGQAQTCLFIKKRKKHSSYTVENGLEKGKATLTQRLRPEIPVSSRGAGRGGEKCET